MKLIYTNKTVKKQCTELRRAKKDFSDKVAVKLHQLITFLEAADSLASVTAFPKYHFHQLKKETRTVCFRYRWSKEFLSVDCGFSGRGSRKGIFQSH